MEAACDCPEAVEFFACAFASASPVDFSVFFAAAWLIGFGSQAWAIHKHETSRAAQSKETETYWNWWEGCRWEADVEPDGTVGAARSVAGGIADFSRAETDNPVADAVDATT